MMTIPKYSNISPFIQSFLPINSYFGCRPDTPDFIGTGSCTGLSLLLRRSPKLWTVNCGLWDNLYWTFSSNSNLNSVCNRPFGDQHQVPSSAGAGQLPSQGALNGYRDHGAGPVLRDEGLIKPPADKYLLAHFVQILATHNI